MPQNVDANMRSGVKPFCLQVRKTFLTVSNKPYSTYVAAAGDYFANFEVPVTVLEPLEEIWPPGNRHVYHPCGVSMSQKNVRSCKETSQERLRNPELDWACVVLPMRRIEQVQNHSISK